MKTTMTKLREAYLYLIGDYLLDSINAPMLKEELENILDKDLTDDDFFHIISENAKAYKVYLLKFKPEDHSEFILLGGRKVGEIGMEPNGTVIDDMQYI